MKTADRIHALRRIFPGKGIEAVIISQPENRYYLSGFNGSAGYLLITAERAVLATDFRYIEQSKQQAPDYEIFQISGGIDTWMPELFSGLNLNTLGFESEYITFAEYKKMTDTLNKVQPKLRLVPREGLVETLRMIKDAEEIDLITRAVRISDEAMKHIEDTICPGMTELEAAWEIEKFMREKGSEAVPFEVIIGAGPYAALPHHRPSSSVIKTGEPIVIDIGAKYNGYASDLTRTICIGVPDEKFHRIYNIVLKAQLEAISTIKTGMTGEEADMVARKVIEAAGYSEDFGHSLGHGVGLAVHELPRLGKKSADTLADGMVFSIEPGIYLPGWGGVRIEDLAVMEHGRVKLLSKARKIPTW